MTWILAQPTLFGQVLVLSDIQVTFKDEKGNHTYEDCLQKMYAMEQNLLVGFAGNVYGGFAMLSAISKDLKVSKNGRTDLVLEPKSYISSWSIKARNLFQRLIPKAKDGDIHLLFAGVSHTEDLGIPGMGKPCVAILKSPDFIPQYAKIGEWISIGSGSDIVEYKKILNKLSGDKIHPIMQMEIQNPGGFASALGITLIMDVQKETEKKGISKHFHVAIISRTGISGGNSDHKEFLGEKNEVEIKMPDVITNLRDFEKYVKDKFGASVVARANL